MNKKFFLILAIFIFTATNVLSAEANKLKPLNSGNEGETKTNSVFDKDTIYYPNANIKSAMAKYKAGNYSGCLQELFSLTKKDPSNALAYYYMAMAYTHLDMQNDAVEAYEKVLALHPNEYLANYAEKGRDCLTGGPKCHPEQTSPAEQDDLDKFINAPYGNGMSPELNNEIKQKELTNIKETINQKDVLEKKDIQRIKDFDSKKNNKSSIEENDKIASVSDEEILNAIKILKDAGLNLTIQQENPYSQYQEDPRMMEMSMFLGNNNNNNMMNMLPMLMTQTQKGENIDPRFMQAMMMNSMMNDINFTNNNNK